MATVAPNRTSIPRGIKSASERIAKSLVDDLGKNRSVVPSRAVSSLRSAETQLYRFEGFARNRRVNLRHCPRAETKKPSAGSPRIRRGHRSSAHRRATCVAFTRLPSQHTGSRGSRRRRGRSWQVGENAAALASCAGIRRARRCWTPHDFSFYCQVPTVRSVATLLSSHRTCNFFHFYEHFDIVLKRDSQGGLAGGIVGYMQRAYCRGVLTGGCGLF